MSMSANIDPELRAAWQVPECDTRVWRGKQHDYCLVIPVINEGGRIAQLLQRISELEIGTIVDIIIVDGGSTDGSLAPERLQAAGTRALLVKAGPGRLGAQLRCAYAFALDEGYDGIVTIDGNNKDDPEAIPRFVEALKSGVDFAQASRFIPGGIAENTPTVRYVAVRWLHAPVLGLASGFRWTDTTQGFRGYSRKMLLDSRIAPFRDVFVAYELLAYLSYRVPKLGYRCLEIPTARRYPPGKVPTKIAGLRGAISILATLIRACFGYYDPNMR